MRPIGVKWSDVSHTSLQLPPLRKPSDARQVVARAHDVTAPVRRLAPATCGELAQGSIDGSDFLVNCPIDRFARASVRTVRMPGLHVHRPDVFAKVRDALALIDPGVARTDLQVRLDGDLLRGKGMASSSAGLAAALTAVGFALGRPFDAQSLSRLIARIEPSDSVQLPGIAHVNHLSGRTIATLPAPAGLAVFVLDSGGAIDTVAFDRERARDVYRRERDTIVGALTLLRRGLRAGDLKSVADAATTSAMLSQRILQQPMFEELLATSIEVGALGVNCAHSGTVLGVLYRADNEFEGRLRHLIDRRFGDSLHVIGNHRVIGGGCHEC